MHTPRSNAVDAWDYTDELFLGPEGSDAGVHQRVDGLRHPRPVLRHRRVRRQV